MSRRSNHFRKLLLETLTPRELLAADASVDWSESHHAPLIGELFDVAIEFENDGDSVGYGPYVDVVVPGGDSGLRYLRNTASVLDLPVNEILVEFDETGFAEHPFAVDSSGAPVILQADPSAMLVVLELPFGSFASDQPTVALAMQLQASESVDVGETFEVVATGGFRYGHDALDNASSDPMLRGEGIVQYVQPQIIVANVEYLGPENETATGENYIRSYRIAFDTAAGKLIERLELHTDLDINAKFVGVRDFDFDASLWNFENDLTDKLGLLDQTLSLALRDGARIDGFSGSFILDVIIPEFNAEGNAVLGPHEGEDALSILTVSSNADFIRSEASEDTPEDRVPIVGSPIQHELEAEALTVQQRVSRIHDSNEAGWGPGDIAEYAIEFQLSDYMILDDVKLLFEVPDGMTLLDNTNVVITLRGLLANSNPITISVPVQQSLPALPGKQDYFLEISDALRHAGVNGRLAGGAVEGVGHSGGVGMAVTGSLTYQTRILDEFLGDVPSGDISVDEGDFFGAVATIHGKVVDPNAGLPTENYTQDGSTADIRLGVSKVQTEIYAINSELSPENKTVSAGDEVTFRVRRQIRHGDIENLNLTSFLPLPVFSIGEIQWATPGNELVSDRIAWGPNHTLGKSVEDQPSVSVNRSNNSIRFDFGSLDWEANSSLEVDLLITLRVVDQPFADGLWLTEVAGSEQGTSNNGDRSSNAATSVMYTRPVLTVRKDAVLSDSPNASVTGNPDTGYTLTGVDAGDHVWFETVVENTGSSPDGAFNVRLRDQLPSGFEIPADGLRLEILDGAGNVISFTGNESDLFHLGIELDTVILPIAASENHRITLRYRLEAESTIPVGSSFESNAEILHYAAVKDGANFVTSPIEDSATIQTASPNISHDRIETDLEHTSGSSVVVGETITYRIIIAVPEGKSGDARLVIDVPRGLTIRDVLSATASSGLRTGNLNSQDWLSALTIESSSGNARDAGDQLILQLEDLVNVDSDNSVSETIEITYRATATNDAVNNAGRSRRNAATWTFGTGEVQKKSDPIRIVEPQIQVVTSFDSSSADAGDIVRVTLDISHNANYGADAFDVLLSKSVPEYTSLVEGSFEFISGVRPVSMNISDGELGAAWEHLPLGENSKLQFLVKINDAVHAEQSLIGAGEINWSSMAGQPGQIVSHSPLSFERTGNSDDAGGDVNDYRHVIQGELKITPVEVELRLIDSSHSHTDGNQLTLGEYASYEIILRIPEGSHRLVLDGLITGLEARMAIDTLTLTRVGESLSGVALVEGETVSVGSDGQIRFDLGAIVNRPDNQGNASDELRFRLDARLLDLVDHVSAESAVIAAIVSSVHGTQEDTEAISIVEPKLRVTQSLGANQVDASDVVSAELVVVHDGEQA